MVTATLLHLRAPLKLALWFLAAVLAAASTWFYFDRILVGQQIADAAAHDRPRGNLSDLYPRWLGARELLRHHRNPYGDEIALEIQRGYYGRALDPTKPNDPKDQQGFAYPVYVVFLLAPLVNLPFHEVQILFHWLLIALTALSVWLWLRALRWRVPCLAIALGVALMVGSVPAVQGIKLQQLTLFVAAMLAASSACVASGFLFCGGILLALATIKPQLAWPLVAWVLVWAAADWRVRRWLVLGFALVMSLLLAGAEIILPGWIAMFFHGLEQYHRYTQNQSVLDMLAPWAFAGKILAAIAVAGCGYLLWKARYEPSTGEAYGRALALVIALTVLIVPMYAPYNQVLLLPAILVLVRDRQRLVSRSRAVRFGYLAGLFALAWQWIASLTLTAAYLGVSHEWALKGWKAPFYATFTLPVLIFALLYLDVRWTGQSGTTEAMER